MSAQQITTDVFLEKYAKDGEVTFKDTYLRVAKGIASVENEELVEHEFELDGIIVKKEITNRTYWTNTFYQNMLKGALGAGRIMSAAGSTVNAALLNCFVQPVGDSIEGADEDGVPGIYEALKQSACTMRRGGGVGYNFSLIRPKGSEVKSVQSNASGPCSYMDIFDASCKTIESAGCFAGDTLINTTEGLIKIKEIVESSKEYFVSTHLGPKRITAKFKSGIKEIWEIITESGHSVKVSPDHKFAQFKIDGSIHTTPIKDLTTGYVILLKVLEYDKYALPAMEAVNITAIKHLPEEETYDLEVEEVHLLSGNGIYTSNSRRGAQLGALNIDHPDILDFIKAKRTPGRWNNFNVSVLVPSWFMELKANDLEVELVHKAKPHKDQIEKGANQREDGMWVYSKIKATELWDIIMKSNYEYAEPGILFETNINTDNNLRAIEYINSTNPCVTGETVILTNNGYQRIDSLVNQEVQIWNGFEWSFVTPVVTGTNQEIFDLEFSDGTKLACTPYHKFILEDGTRIEAKDLQFNHKLSKFTFPIIDSGVDLDYKRSYTQGFYSGDGQKNTNRIWLYEDKCYLVNHLAISACSDQSNDRQKRIMATLDFIPNDKNFVPNTNYSIKTRLAWLSGLIDSDGSVCDKTVTIWSVDRIFLMDVKFLLNTLGVNGTVSLGRQASNRLLPNAEGTLTEYNTQDCWRITISGFNINVLKSIGLYTNRVILEGEVNRNASRFTQLTFKQKRNYLEPQVYCFNEEKNHSGIFNGIMTAQCAEQPLPKYGCCDLGPINLTKFVYNPFTNNSYFDYMGLEKAVGIQVRFLDNVLDATMWPLEEQRIEAANKRRIGVGFTGLANALAMLGMVYYEEDSLTVAEKIVRSIRDAAYIASVNLAKERGPFKLFNAEQYLEEGTFASRLPDDIKTDIHKFGIRNSHLLSVAPVGTISLAFCDNASNGIEPPFSLAYTRKKREADGSWKEYAVLDHSFREYIKYLRNDGCTKGIFINGLLDAVVANNKEFILGSNNYIVKNELPKYFVTALEMTPSQHLSMMRVVQPFIDSSISKTVNVPTDYPYDDFKNIYDEAWRNGLKGVSTYKPNDILGSVLSITEHKEEPKQELKSKTIDKTKWKEDLKPIETAKDINPFELMIHKRPQGVLKSETDKISYYGYNGDYTFYISVSYLEMDRIKDGVRSKVQRPIEIFVTVSPTSLPVEWVTTYCRTMSKIARTSFAMFAETLQDNRSISSGQHPIRYDFFTKPDGTKVPRHHESDVAVISYAIQRMLKIKKLLDEDGNVCNNYNCSEETYLTQREINSLLCTVTDESLLSQEDLDALLEGVTETVIPNTNRTINGKLCDKCGAHSVIKKEGCQFCTACGETGNCG